MLVPTGRLLWCTSVLSRDMPLKRPNFKREHQMNDFSGKNHIMAFYKFGTEGMKIENDFIKKKSYTIKGASL